MSDGFLTRLAEGFAQMLADASIGLAWYTGSGVYSGPDVPVSLMKVPQDPDVVCVLSPYLLRAESARAMSLYGLQVRFRSGPDPRQIFDLSSASQDVLLGRYPLTLPTGVRISTLEFSGGGSLGQDGNSRWEWADNYRLNAHQPGTYRH